MGDARESIQQAIAVYRQRGKEYQSLVATKNLAECDFREGHIDRGLQILREVEARVPGLEESRDRFGVFVNLASACRRADLPWFEYQYLSLALDETEDVEQILAVSDHLLNLKGILDLSPRIQRDPQVH